MANTALHLHLSRSPTISESRATSISLLPSPTSFSSSSSINQTMRVSSPTMGTGSPAKASHTCPSCSRSFSRGEHLDRHLTTHLPSNSSKAFICQSCSKGFTRKDVLTRHIRAVHETKRPDVRKSRRRSCRRCAGFKIKCSGGGRGTSKNGTREGGRAEDPCEACKKRGAVCIYDFGTISEAGDTESRSSGGLDMSPKTRGENRSGDGDGDDDDLLDFGSDGAGSMTSESEVDRRPGSKGGEESSHKRRKTTDGTYTTSFTGLSSFDEVHRPVSSRVSPHLMSAARLASSRNGSPGRSSEPSTSSTSLQNLITNDQTAELSSADQLISLMTTNTYGAIPTDHSLDGLRTNSGSQTPQKGPLSVDIPIFGSKPHPLSKSPPIPQPGVVSQSSNPDLYRARNDYFQPRKLSNGVNHFPHHSVPHGASAPLSPFRDVLPSPSGLGESISSHDLPIMAFEPESIAEDLNAANTLQGINPISPSRSPLGHFQSGPTPKPTDISSFVSETPEASQRTNDFPPVSFTVDYNQLNQSKTAMQPSLSSTGSFQGGNLGPSTPQPSLTANINGIELDNPEPEGNPSYGNDLPGLENDDNWFFDFGIFDTSTDWLRGWGDDSSTLDMLGGTCSVAPPPHAGATASCLTPGAAVSHTKGFASPASAHSDESSVYGHGRREDHQTRLPSVSPIKDHSSVEDFLPWGWQSCREEPKRRVTLPPLRQILEEYTPSTIAQRYDSTRTAKDGNLVNERIRNDMVSLLSIPYERYPYESADMSKFPTKKMIDGFIKLYFEQFHSNLPMIHKPTFSTETCPTIVLVAMASIGASYSDVEGAKIFADTLSELCKRTLTWMAEFNPEYPRSDFFLKALCLQSVYALGSGSHRLYDSADVSRSFLIGNARRIGLFSGTVSPPTSSPPSAPSSPGPLGSSQHGKPTIEDSLFSRDSSEKLEARWSSWRKQEELKRLAWSIFEYDCSFSTLSNRRGAITLNDISTRMPCAEALWEAPTAQAWASLLDSGAFTQSSFTDKGTRFYPTLRDVISEKISPETLTSWGKRLCAQAMGRILWDFKELEESVLSVGGSSNTSGLTGGGLGLPMLSPGLKPAKETLLRSLKTLCNGIRERQMEGGGREGEVDGDRVHMILTCLISHYTHLHAAFPTVSLILSLARRPPSSAEHPVDPRIIRLKTIFSTDPVYARTLAWNAAQIISISRWKPVFSPVEGMRIFMAGVVLWGFGRYFREPPSSQENTRSTPSSPIRGVQEQIVRLDSHPWTGIQGTAGYRPDDWVKNGKAKATIGNDDPEGNAMTEICSDRGAREVLRVVVGILGRMRVWGLGGEFKSVLEEMVRRS